ncbi:MAG: GNAT family N-acetyltransferase [Cellulosilyticaceae bacterium]
MLYNDKVVLRDFIESDIEKRIYWETVDTEWQLWDGPWEYEELNAKQKEDDLKKYIETMGKWVNIYSEMPKDVKRTSFQITLNNANSTYIGWCSSYKMNNQYEFSKEGTMRAIGIDIPDTSARNKGYATATLVLFIQYLLDQGETAIYTQTWSGNTRMIALAGKLGFEECNRKVNFRTVRGTLYDGLTFRLNLKKFEALCEKL